VAQSVAALITVHGLLSFLSGKTLWLSVIFLFLRMYGFISFSEFFYVLLSFYFTNCFAKSLVTLKDGSGH